MMPFSILLMMLTRDTSKNASRNSSKLNNQQENHKRIPYKYNIGDWVSIKGDYSAKYANIAYKGPYTVTAVNNNGAVHVDMGIISDVINICNVHPYPSK